MKYVRKTRDELELYGVFEGRWEYICTAEDANDAKQLLQCYRENDPRPYKIVKRRVKI